MMPHETEDLSERFDYPPHPELCGRCCAGANDQR